MAQPTLSAAVGAGGVVWGGRFPPPSILSGGVVADLAAPAGGLDGGPLAPFTVVPDGNWTWFTRPEAVQVGGHVYVGWVSSAGTCGATQLTLADGTLRHKALSAIGLEVDDHNNTSILPLPDGRICFFYGQHNDQTFRYRIFNPAAGAFDGATAWTNEEARGTGNGPYSYPNPIIFSQDSPKTWLFKRRWLGGGGTRALSFRTSPSLLGAAPHTWSAFTDVYLRTNFIPYWRTAHDGVSRVHFAITDGHPVQGQISLFHFYGQLDGANMRWYRSNGSEITASLPFGPGDATLVYDGSTTRCWVSDCVIGADGHPRILWMRYPGNNGSQIEYWHSRWTGTVWVNTFITTDGAGLYSPEVYYHGGLAFCRLDPTRIVLSAPIVGVRHIQEWRTADGEVSWTQARVLTSGGTAGNPLRFRPIGVQGGDGRVRYLWPQGSYSTFTAFNTSIIGAG